MELTASPDEKVAVRLGVRVSLQHKIRTHPHRKRERGERVVRSDVMTSHIYTQGSISGRERQLLEGTAVACFLLCGLTPQCS